MNRLLVNVIIAVFGLALAPLVSAELPAPESEDPAQLALKGLDPILLISGEESEGLEKLSLVHAGYEYRFTRRSHLDTFSEDPGRYAIQLDGACAAMPGSGGADPELFMVYNDLIYIFGSTIRREHFSDEPEHFLSQHEDPNP
jgi:YHS domain-containing protein